MSRTASLPPPARRELLAERVRRRMTVAEFAELLGVDGKTLRRLERGESVYPQTLYRIADALERDPLEWFGVEAFALGNGHTADEPADQPDA